MLNRICTLVVLLSLCPSTAFGGAKIALDEDRYLSLGLLLQPQIRLLQDGTYDEEGWSFDPRIRRVRVLLYGQYTKLVSFFVETDHPKLGERGNWDVPFFIQDAFVELNLHESLQIDVGMVLIPFSHHGSQGATSLLGLDYHGGSIKYRPGSSLVWRDVGVVLRGLVFDKKLDYRIAITNGVQSGHDFDPYDPRTEMLNRDDYPWFTGRVVLNLFDAEGGPGPGGFFLDGLYLKRDGDCLISPKKIVSLGFGATYQGRATNGGPGGDTAGFFGLAGDLFVDYPLAAGKQAINGQVDFYYYRMGEEHDGTGYGLLAEAGYRYHCIEPVIAFDWFNATNNDAQDLLAIRGGINWWFLGHNTNLKVEFGGARTGPSENDFQLTGTAQVQLLF